MHEQGSRAGMWTNKNYHTVHQRARSVLRLTCMPNLRAHNSRFNEMHEQRRGTITLGNPRAQLWRISRQHGTVVRFIALVRWQGWAAARWKMGSLVSPAPAGVNCWLTRIRSASRSPCSSPRRHFSHDVRVVFPPSIYQDKWVSNGEDAGIPRSLALLVGNNASAWKPAKCEEMVRQAGI